MAIGVICVAPVLFWCGLVIAALGALYQIGRIVVRAQTMEKAGRK